MRTARLIFTSLVLLVGTFGCGDEDQGPAPAFTGVTVRDEIGMVVSEDPDDWLLDCPGTKDVPAPVIFGPIAYPNPVALSVTIQFPMFRAGSAVIQIWAPPDHRGSPETLVRSLVAQVLPAGMHAVVWDCRDSVGGRVSPGVYRCRYQFLECAGHGDIEVQALPEVSAAARLFASEHWSVQRLSDACSSDFESPAMYYYAASAIDGLPQWSAMEGDESALHFAIGHCDQFVFGWDDYVDPRGLPALGPDYSYQDLSQTVVSLRREAYLGLK